MPRAAETSPPSPYTSNFSGVSMTTLATRPPLQQLDNPHIMSQRGNGRRTSARLADKGTAPLTDGYPIEPMKKSQPATGGKQSKPSSTDIGVKGGGKRKPAYDEEDDGFMFSRTRSKKPRTTPVGSTSQDKHIREEPIQLAEKPKSKRKSFTSPTAAIGVNEAVVEKRRSARHTSETPNSEIDGLTIKKRRKPREASEAKQDQGEDPFKPKRTIPRTSTEARDRSPSAQISFDATKIALPFADTPIIRRNKEMRKGTSNGSRRSSLGNRGRRASSLIESGKSNALPHAEVESSEFYKHIESDGMPEPRRMRQLLMWCGARALGDKPSFEKGDGNARLAAREIQSQLLKDFSTKSNLSDWFDRREATPPPVAPKVNPKNQSNLAKIHELQQQIARLQEESQTWQNLLRPPPEKALQLPAASHESLSPLSIDSTLLADPNQRAALSTLQTLEPDSQPSLAAAASSRLQKFTKNVEFEVDKFATNVHALESFKDAAERLADETLATAAEILERRDKESTRRAIGDDRKESSIRNVLRGLSRIIDR